MVPFVPVPMVACIKRLFPYSVPLLLSLILCQPIKAHRIHSTVSSSTFFLIVLFIFSTLFSFLRHEHSVLAWFCVTMAKEVRLLPRTSHDYTPTVIWRKSQPWAIYGSRLIRMIGHPNRHISIGHKVSLIGRLRIELRHFHRYSICN